MSDADDPRTEYQRRLDALEEGLLEAFEAGYCKALADADEADGELPAPETVRGSEYLAECSFYYWDGRVKPLVPWLKATLTDSGEITTLDADGECRVMLHYGGDGPVEVEVWDEATETAAHVHTGFRDRGKQSVDITEALVTALQEGQR
jgi:hypothetical protein